MAGRDRAGRPSVRCGSREAHLPRRAPLLPNEAGAEEGGRRPKKRSAKKAEEATIHRSSSKRLSPTPLYNPLHVTARVLRSEGRKAASRKKHNHTETPGSEPRQAAMHPSDSFYAHYVHPRPESALIRTFHPALRRSRGLVALVRLGGSSSIARGGNGRPCVLNVLANLCDDVRANCDIPAILQALGALGCASSLEYLAAGRCGSREACL